MADRKAEKGHPSAEKAKQANKAAKSEKTEQVDPAPSDVAPKSAPLTSDEAKETQR
jgi:hypothetical protein